MFSNFSFSFC